MSSFAAWLLQQAGRSDEVGDVARLLRLDDQLSGCDTAMIAESYDDVAVHWLFDHELDPGYLEALRVARGVAGCRTGRGAGGLTATTEAS